MTTNRKTRKSRLQLEDLQRPVEDLTSDQAQKVKGGALAITYSISTGTKTAGQQLLTSELSVSK